MCVFYSRIWRHYYICFSELAFASFSFVPFSVHTPLPSFSTCLFLSVSLCTTCLCITHSHSLKCCVSISVSYSSSYLCLPGFILSLFLPPPLSLAMHISIVRPSKEEDICCFASTSSHGRRVARVGLLVRLTRVPFHQRRRRRGGHAPSHGHRGGTLAWSRPPVVQQPLAAVTEADPL